MQSLDGSIVLILMLVASFFLGRIYLGPLLRRKNDIRCEGSAACGCSRASARKSFADVGRSATEREDRIVAAVGERPQ